VTRSLSEVDTATGATDTTTVPRNGVRAVSKILDPPWSWTVY